MARIDDLISHIADRDLRDQLSRAVSDIRRRKKFGLVFEEHIPETVLLSGAGVHEGSQVVMRTEPTDRTRYLVEAVDERTATIRANGSDKSVKARLDDLLVIKPFGEPVYPVLRQTGAVTKNSDKPYHAVVNGENFHALQLALYTCNGQVDCIYIDPPYNTGARDWKYNNDYVDDQDAWRHSKWLSMMEKRLRLARKLLKPDGVLIVTIDEHEMANLGVLLRDVFKGYLTYAVSIVINSRGSTGTRNFGVINEYALFVVPDLGYDLIEPREKYIRQLSAAGAAVEVTDDEDDEAVEAEVPAAEATPTIDEGETAEPEAGYWTTAYRTGQGTSFRHQRPKQFYPIFLDSETKQPVGVGEPLLAKKKDGSLKAPSWASVGGNITVWPVDQDGEERVWAWEPERMAREIATGNVRTGKYNKKRKTFALSVRRVKATEQRFKERTVWWEPSYDAGANGTALLKRLLGGSGKFQFPKSVYATRDTLATVVGGRKDALVLDFFAGSGTTLHATALLNALDGGSRRCILVTNNDVEEKTARKLNEQGYFVGDPEFEAQGICKAVTEPRVRAALTGQRPDGTAVPGKYKWAEGRVMAEGFDDNTAFFDLIYEDPDTLELGGRFEDIIPALWLAAGGHGDPASLELDGDLLLPATAPMAALLDEDRFRAFRTALEKRPDISHIWLVTDSETAFARMRESLPANRIVGMLYRDYLRNFQINTEVSR